jgi:hypothetical protein
MVNETGEIYAEAGDELDEKLLALKEAGSRNSRCSTSITSNRCVHPQHADGSTRTPTARSADRHLPRDASGRAADDRSR